MKGFPLRMLLLAILCLLAGAGIYILLRPTTLFVEYLSLPSMPYRVTSNYFVSYCLSDGLWYLALLLLQYIFMMQQNITSRTILYIAIVLPFLLEGLQTWEWFGGTFDWFDILTYCVTLIVFVICVENPFFSLVRKLSY